MNQPVLSCPRETDVLDLVAIGQWPGRADRDLAVHVASCERCADLAIVAAAVLDLRDTGDAQGRVPDGELVWYRVQLRAREEAVRRAARPVLIAQIAALLLIAGALLTWASGQTDSIAAAATATWTGARDLLSRRPDWPGLGSGDPVSTVLSPRMVGSLAAGLVAAVALAFGVSRLADGDR